MNRNDSRELRQAVVIVGGGGHARPIIDSMEMSGLWEIVGLVDPNPNSGYRSYTVLCDDGGLKGLFASGVQSAVVGVGHVGDVRLRRKLLSNLEEMGFLLPAIVDQTAALARDVQVSKGVYIGKHAVVNSAASIGAGAIINTAAVVEHDCVIGECAHVAVNATLCGGVTIGDGAMIGAGAVVLQGVIVGSNAIVGAGAVVTDDIPNRTTVVGVPARRVVHSG